MRITRDPLKATAVRWVVLGLVSSIYFVTYIDRVNISIAAPTISTELGIGPAVMGLIFSAFSVPYTLLQMPGGWLADRIGPRRALSGMGLLWAFSTALTAVPASAVGLAIARLGVGLAEGGAFPAATRAFTTWIPSARRGLAQGLPHSFARLGGAAAPPLVVALTLAYGWRIAFVALGGVSLLLMLVWAWFYRDRPRDHWLTNPAEVELLEREASAPVADARATATPWRALLRRMWPVTVVDFCYGWSLWVFLTWLPSYLSSGRHLALEQLALFASLPLLGGMFGDAIGGILTDWLWRRNHRRLARAGQSAVGLLLSLAFVVPAVSVASPVTAVWLLSASFFALEISNAPLWASAMDIGGSHAGVGAGMMNTGFGVAGIISPFVFGALVQATGTWSLPFLLSAVLLLAGAAVACLFIDPIGPLMSMQPSALSGQEKPTEQLILADS